MNRVIKFRGKRLDNGEWAYGFYNIYLLAKADDRGYDELPVIYNDRCPDFGGGSWRNVSKETVGQFTGLTDVNGREIYEGDIVCLYHEEHCTYKGIVRYQCGQFLAYKNDGLQTPLGLKPWIIVGNIHENPEMLEGGEG